MATNRRLRRRQEQQRQRDASDWGAGGGTNNNDGKGGSARRGKGRRGRQQQQRQQQPERSVIRPPKNYLKKLDKHHRDNGEEVPVPPALLAPTASPYVYISKTALGVDDDDDTAIDPSELFAEVAYGDSEDGVLPPPPIFARGDFHYFSPKKDLNYEYPCDGRPEIAFLGRSNVGKSSLINAIMRKNLCLTSRVPGRTQLPYYYGLVPKTATATAGHVRGALSSKNKGRDPATAGGFIVDLPGYGYGRAPTSVTEDWQTDTQDLLLHRRHEAGVLRRLFLLMDARRGMEGPNEHDRIVMRWLEDAEIPFSVVLTKADRVSVPLVVRQVNDFCLRFASQQQQHEVVAQSPVVHVTSSAKAWGIHELMVSIEAEFCGEEDDDDEEEEENFGGVAGVGGSYLD